MLSELLSYSKPLELKPEQVSFADAANEAGASVQKQADDKRVTISLQGGLEHVVLAVDPEQFNRALTNLLANAIHAAPPGGEVTLGASLSPQAPCMVNVTVCDNGPGLPPRHMDKLFQPFFTTRKDGTGLGLANVKKIVELHGGSVTAANRPGGGAIFSITVPRGDGM